MYIWIKIKFYMQTHTVQRNHTADFSVLNFLALCFFLLCFLPTTQKVLIPFKQNLSIFHSQNKVRILHHVLPNSTSHKIRADDKAHFKTLKKTKDTFHVFTDAV